MSKKNSNAILKNGFKDFEDLSKIYLNFKNKLNKLNKKSYLIAVSGGPDSLALAALSKAYNCEKKSIFHYVLVDHNIRKDSSKEAKQVKSLLIKNSITLNVILNKVKVDKNIQGQARDLRYKNLINFCKKKKVKFILTAHNLEDQVETFFIRLSRGSGLTGLSAMKPLSKLNNDIKLYRPLLDVKKKALIKISKYVFKKYFKDPSNKDNKYLRTRIRNLKEPLKQSGINYDQVIKSINNLASSRATLDGFLIKIFKETIKKTKNKILIDLKKFNNFNNEIKMRIINEAIKKLKNNYYNPRSKKVIRLIESLKSRSFSGYTLGGCLFIKINGKLCLKEEKN